MCWIPIKSIQTINIAAVKWVAIRASPLLTCVVSSCKVNGVGDMGAT